MTFPRGCYHQILGPSRHLPKLSNGLCRHAGAYVRLNLHFGWQAAESYVERSNAFALVPGHRLLPDCSAAGQPTVEGTSFARHVSEREHGMLEGLPDNKLDVVPNALGWRLGPLILRFCPERVETKEAMELQLDQACCGNEHGHFRAPIRRCFAMPAGSRSPTSSGRASLAVV